VFGTVTFAGGVTTGACVSLTVTVNEHVGIGALGSFWDVPIEDHARVIEVKTTGLGKHFPFYVSANELRVSQQRARDYHLYRVFNFASAPRMYPLNGALDQVCRLEPPSFVARVG